MNVLKLLGAVITVSCGVAVGISKRKNISQHAAFISGMAIACEKIATEISLRRTPPWDIFKRLADDATPSGRFFSAVSMRTASALSTEVLWTEALGDFTERYGLSKGERSELERIGTVLSRYDLDNAVSTIASIGTELSAKSKELDASVVKDGKMWLSICSAVGAAIALVLF